MHFAARTGQTLNTHAQLALPLSLSAKAEFT